MSQVEFRVAFTYNDFERAVRFFRDGLGLEPGDLWTDNGKCQIFWSGCAALEIFDPQYAAGVDQIKIDERVSGQIRFAFQVEDVYLAMERALEHGANLVHEPVLTPWNDLNARIQSPDGRQITLFQVHAENNHPYFCNQGAPNESHYLFKIRSSGSSSTCKF